MIIEILLMLFISLFPIFLILIALYRKKLKKAFYGMSHKPFFVAHMLVRVGNAYIEKTTNIVELKSKTFQNEKHEYIFVPEKTIWRPTGIFGAPELHAYYEVGKTLPLGFEGSPVAVDAELQSRIVEEKLMRNILKGMQPGLELSLRQIIIFTAIIIGIAVIAYIVLVPFLTPHGTPPVVGR